MPTTKRQQAHHWLAGVLAAASFTAVLSLVGIEKRDCSLDLAVMLFSVALPFDIFIFIFPVPPTFKRKIFLSDWFYIVVFLLYLPFSLGGICAIFWHFGLGYGLVFLSASLFLCCLRPFLSRYRQYES
jgi:hypothetical protein